MYKKDMSLLHNQYHGCWWPGNTGSQVISIHGIDLVLQEYSYQITKSVNYTFSFLSAGTS